MRPQELRRRTRLAIQRTLKTEDWDNICKIKPELVEFLEYCRKVEEWYYWDGYVRNTYHRSLDELGYISDRFTAYHRIDWLLYCTEEEDNYAKC